MIERKDDAQNQTFMNIQSQINEINLGMSNSGEVF